MESKTTTSFKKPVLVSQKHLCLLSVDVDVDATKTDEEFHSDQVENELKVKK